MSVPFRIVWMFLLLIGALFFLFYNEPEATNFDEGSSPAQMVSGPHRVTVILERSFLDGSVTEEIIEEEILSMEDFFSEYAEWTLVDMDDEQVVFMQKVDDISPFIKDHGFFGITEDGVLSIFNGIPEQSDAIQSFFQIDIQKLESSKHKNLIKGIKIQSKKDYEEVIEQLKTFKIES